MPIDNSRFYMNILRKKSGFTLIELLTVIAIIGILAAIAIPTTAAVRVSAKKAQTKGQFSQWANAFGLYRQEYGYFPKFDADGFYIFKTNADAEMFSGTLSGKALDGTAPTAANLNGNKKKLAFYTLSGADLSSQVPASALIRDAFDNTEIGVIVDTSGDGRITLGSGASDDAPALGSAYQVSTPGGANFTPSITDIPAAGIRSTVLFYSAGKDGSAVMSWQ